MLRGRGAPVLSAWEVTGVPSCSPQELMPLEDLEAVILMPTGLLRPEKPWTFLCVPSGVLLSSRRRGVVCGFRGLAVRTHSEHQAPGDCVSFLSVPQLFRGGHFQLRGQANCAFRGCTCFSFQ